MYSSPTAEPVVLAAVEPAVPAAEPTVPTTEPAAEPVVPSAGPGYITVFKAISKG